MLLLPPAVAPIEAEMQEPIHTDPSLCVWAGKQCTQTVVTLLPNGLRQLETIPDAMMLLELLHDRQQTLLQRRSQPSRDVNWQ